MKTIEIRLGILGIKDGKEFVPAKGIILHENPDLDCAGVVWLLRHCGITYGRIWYQSTRKDGLVGGKTSVQWLEEGWILADVGAAMSERPNGQLTHLDHHPQTYYPGECATSICFKLLLTCVPEKIDEKVEKIVKFITARDLRGGQMFLDLAHIIKIWAPKLPANEVVEYTVSALEAFYGFTHSTREFNCSIFNQKFTEFANGKKEVPELLLFHHNKIISGKTDNIPDILSVATEGTKDLIRFILEEAYDDQKEFQHAKRVFAALPKIQLGNRDFLVACDTDNRQFQKVSLKNGASIIVVRNGKKQIQIFTQKTARIKIGDIMAAVRCEELRKRGLMEPVNFAELHKDGTSAVIPIWHFFKTGGMILNGSHTTPNQEPTALSLEEIIDIIRKVQMSYMPVCKGGKYNCVGRKCLIYNWGQENCRKLRGESINIPNRKKEIVLMAQ